MEVAGPPGPGAIVEAGPVERLPNTCRLEEFERFRGLPAIEVPDEGLGRPARVIGPEDIVSQEFDPARVNFYTDSTGVVARIGCG